MDLYYLPTSPPCRTVIMCAQVLGLELNMILLNTENGDNLKPEFLKLNPQHTIPTLVDGDFSIWESRAIIIYLAEKYAKDDTLYPKCPKKQAVINQRLYFDMEVLHQAFADYYTTLLMVGQLTTLEHLKRVHQAFYFFNMFLEDSEYAAGDTYTLADIALLSTVNTFDLGEFDIDEYYPNVSRWYARCKEETVGFEENWEGSVILRICLEMNRQLLSMKKEEDGDE